MRGLRRKRGVERGVEARDRRHVRQRSRHRVERSERLGLVKRCKRHQLAQRRLDSARRSPRPRESARRRERFGARPHRAAPAARLSAAATASASTSARGAASSLDHSSLSSRVEQRQLQAARPSVDYQYAQPSAAKPGRHVRAPHPRTATGPGPVAHVGRVVPMLARVGAMAQALVGHLLAQPRGPLAEPGHAVDHVHHEMEAVEVVQHRPCRTAWWWCPPPCSRARAGWGGCVRR